MKNQALKAVVSKAVIAAVTVLCLCANARAQDDSKMSKMDHKKMSKMDHKKSKMSHDKMARKDTAGKM